MINSGSEVWSEKVSLRVEVGRTEKMFMRSSNGGDTKWIERVRQDKNLLKGDGCGSSDNF